MRITRTRKINAASDFRRFDGFTVEELQEIYPDIFEDMIEDIQEDIDEIYISKNPACPFYGVKELDGSIDLWVPDRYGRMEGPGWFEVTFEELAQALC